MPRPGHQAPSCSAFLPTSLLSFFSAGCLCLAALPGTTGCPLLATASLTKFSCPSGSGTNVTSTLSHHPTQGTLSPCTVLAWALINHLALYFFVSERHSELLEGKALASPLVSVPMKLVGPSVGFLGLGNAQKAL